VTIDTAKYAILAPATTELGVNGTLEPADLPRVHIPLGGGTVWQVPGLNGAGPVDQLVGIVLRWRDTRAFWPRGAEEDARGAPPDCSSPDAITAVGDPGGSCRDCPFARFASASNGRGQACRLTRELLFVRPDDRIPLVISIPPSSYTAVRRFFLFLPVAHYHAVLQLALSPVRQTGRIFSLVAPQFLGIVDPKYHAQLTELHRMLAK